MGFEPVSSTETGTGDEEGRRLWASCQPESPGILGLA